jgi:hypothetical protein
MDRELELKHAHELKQRSRELQAGLERMARELDRTRQLADDSAAKHRHHLCHLVQTGQMAAVRQLVGDGAHFCSVCGRVAARAANLCDPEPRVSPE